MSEKNPGIIYILLAIQDDSLHDGVKDNLSRFDDIQIIDEIDDFDNLVDAVSTQSPEIVLISTNQWNSVVSGSIKTIIRSFPGVSIITMLENLDDMSIYTVLVLGVSACLSNEINSDDLITNIRKVWNGENPIFDTLTRPGIARLINEDMRSDLKDAIVEVDETRKILVDIENEILYQIADGDTLDQITSKIKISENDIINHLTSIYGKIIFNNYCEFSIQQNEKSGSYNQLNNENLVETNLNKPTVGLYTPEITIEKEDNINLKDILDEQTMPIFEGFEVLKKELQETLDILAPADDNPVKQDEEEREGISSANEEDNTLNKHSDESVSLDMHESQEWNIGDFELIDQDYDSKLGNIVEKALPVEIESITNNEHDRNEFEVNDTEAHGETQQEKPESTRESEAREYEKSVSKKSKWFKFSSKPSKRNVVKNNNLAKNDDLPENETANIKPGSESENLPDSTDKKEQVLRSIKQDNKVKLSVVHPDSQEAVLSSLRGLGIPVFINTPVDGKQIEKFESTIKHIERLNVILRKGTSHGHVLVIAGQDYTELLKTLNDIPMVESTTDKKGTITVKLASIW